MIEADYIGNEAFRRATFELIDNEHDWRFISLDPTLNNERYIALKSYFIGKKAFKDTNIKEYYIDNEYYRLQSEKYAVVRAMNMDNIKDIITCDTRVKDCGTGDRYDHYYLNEFFYKYPLSPKGTNGSFPDDAIILGGDSAASNEHNSACERYEVIDWEGYQRLANDDVESGKISSKEEFDRLLRESNTVAFYPCKPANEYWGGYRLMESPVKLIEVEYWYEDEYSFDHKVRTMEYLFEPDIGIDDLPIVSSLSYSRYGGRRLTLSYRKDDLRLYKYGEEVSVPIEEFLDSGAEGNEYIFRIYQYKAEASVTFYIRTNREDDNYKDESRALYKSPNDEEAIDLSLYDKYDPPTKDKFLTDWSCVTTPGATELVIPSYIEEYEKSEKKEFDPTINSIDCYRYEMTAEGTITFEANGGKVVGSTEIGYGNYYTIREPKVEKPGYKLMYWTSVDESEYNKRHPDGDISLEQYMEEHRFDFSKTVLDNQIPVMGHDFKLYAVWSQVDTDEPTTDPTDQPEEPDRPEQPGNDPTDDPETPDNPEKDPTDPETPENPDDPDAGSDLTDPETNPGGPTTDKNKKPNTTDKPRVVDSPAEQDKSKAKRDKKEKRPARAANSSSRDSSEKTDDSLEKVGVTNTGFSEGYFNNPLSFLAIGLGSSFVIYLLKKRR